MLLMGTEYVCRKCSSVLSSQDLLLSRFCPNCGAFIIINKIKKPKVVDQNTIIEINPDDINLNSLFGDFINYGPINVGAGFHFPSVETWISSRKRKYVYFSRVFSIKNDDLTYVCHSYKRWLSFKNNLSWTTLERSGYKALSEKKRLAKLIKTLYDQEISLEKKVWRCLRGRFKINGIGKGITTALLHTFDFEKNGVWNNKTCESLELLGRLPKSFVHIGKNYVAINKILNEMAAELSTDLTTIDAFMWFINQKVKIRS